jgi:hypothetical protein
MPPPQLPPPQAPRLQQQVRERARSLHYSLRTEQAYVHWVRAFVRFHRMALLGHSDASMTLIHTHVLKVDGSPLDALQPA